MKYFLLFAALAEPWAAAIAWNAYDLGFHGLYPRHRFHSVDFEAPEPKITRWDSRCDSGNLLLTPRGPLVTGAARGPVMLDAHGNLIWMDNHQFEQVMNLRAQKYKGEDYLTFWTKNKKTKKTKHAKHSKTSYVLLNSSYEVAHRVFPHGKGLKGDSHEFHITPQDTALITIYQKHQTDCRGLGLGKSCWIQDGLFQEIDIETGDLIFEWRASDHIRQGDVFSYPNRKDGYGKSKKDAFDFFHINSVDKIDTGDYIISARYMHAIMCISGKTGETLWQLGGKHNRFEDLNGATDFSWQHHVTWLGNDTISLFDNHANNVFHSPTKHSKGMIIHLDMDKMTARVLRTFVHPDGILNVSQGSIQVIPGHGNVLVGFGNSPTYIEYSADGTVLCSAHFAPHIAFELIDFGLVKSYRVFKSPWVGRPKTVPDVKVRHGKVYVSWNGATEVTGWRLETTSDRGVQEDTFVTIQELERDGFETKFGLGQLSGRGYRYLRIGALDAAKEVMAYSEAVRTPSSSALSFWPILFIFAFAACFLGFVGFVFIDKRLPRLPRLGRLGRVPRLLHFSALSRFPRLSGLRKRSNGVVLGGDEDDDEDSEFAPLLLDERDP